MKTFQGQEIKLILIRSKVYSNTVFTFGIIHKQSGFTNHQYHYRPKYVFSEKTEVLNCSWLWIIFYKYTFVNKNPSCWTDFNQITNTSIGNLVPCFQKLIPGTGHHSLNQNEKYINIMIQVYNLARAKIKADTFNKHKQTQDFKLCKK